jgi:hypothetical protein
MRMRTMIALALLGALAVVALAIPASAHDNDRTDHRRGGHDLPSLGSGGKLTLALLERGESQSLAEVYASEETGEKVKRAMRRGLIVYCHPGGYDTLSFTCEGTPPPLETTVPETTTLETTTPPATASTPATASAPATTP